MLGLRESKMRAMALVAVFLSSFFPAVLGLRVASGSPCASRCNKWGSSDNTTSSEISCVDGAFNTTSKGKDFQDCITCGLKSTYEDETSGATDVNWALFNLRYALSSCIFEYPDHVSNVSTPCPVACGTVQPAIQLDIEDPTVDNIGTWCDSSSFADNVINTCEFCYNLTSNQIYLANFMESIRYNCHFPTVTGDEFAVSPSRIFTESLLPSSMSLSTPSSGGSHVNLGLVIAVPVLAFIIICLGIGTCCFFYIRYRRRKSRQNRFQNHAAYPNVPPEGFADQTMYSDYQAFAQSHAAGYGQQAFNEQYGQAHEMYGINTGKQGFQAHTSEMTVPAPHAGADQHGIYAIGDQKHPM
ncbi:hypothetical protein N7456_004753 [Penicillium angulare]|uniref:Uncharacterized protein n=1 Tax=Penicillium angulare TaxID=116970 RepID=A0A9W9FXA5_9EURO|nr:hypothetical protein N7456_004753 [Penicillium angulare]